MSSTNLNIFNELNDSFEKEIENKQSKAKARHKVLSESLKAKKLKESEESKKQILNEDNSDAFNRIKHGEKVYFRDSQGVYCYIDYADDYEEPEEYDNGYTSGWEKGKDPKYDKEQEDRLNNAKEAAEYGNVWEVVECDKNCNPTGNILTYAYGEDELKYVLDGLREVKIKTELEESKKITESDESILRLVKKSIVNGKLPEEIEYKGKTYKQFYVMNSDNSGETSDIYYCNMENTPSGDPQESNDYFYLKVALNKTENGYKGIKEIRFAEDLTESKKVTESVISDMKKKGLYDYIVNEYYNMDKDKLADIAKEAVYILYNKDKDLIKTYKENLKEYTDIENDIIEAADGHYMDYLSAHYSELSKSDLKDFAKEALALIMDNNLVDKYIEDLKDNTIWADDEDDLEESKKITEADKVEVDKDGNKSIRDKKTGHLKRIQVSKKTQDKMADEYNKKQELNEAGEWDDSDSDMQAWKESMREAAEEIARNVDGECKSVHGFDAYQGPFAVVSTPKHGDVIVWFGQEEGLFDVQVAHVGWIEGSIEGVSLWLNKDKIPQEFIIKESEKFKDKELKENNNKMSYENDLEESKKITESEEDKTKLEDRLASLKTQLEVDGDQLADDEKESIEKEIADLEAKVYPIKESSIPGDIIDTVELTLDDKGPGELRFVGDIDKYGYYQGEVIVTDYDPDYKRLYREVRKGDKVKADIIKVPEEQWNDYGLDDENPYYINFHKDLKEDTNIQIPEVKVEPDYIINDVTELDQTSDGDVQAPDIDSLITLVDENLTAKYGKDWGHIKILSSAKMNENSSYALVDISTKEIIKEFENSGINDVAIGKNLIIESAGNYINFKVNSLNGNTRFSKKTKNAAKTITEWVETEFLHESMIEDFQKQIDKRYQEEKDAIEDYIKTRPELKTEIDNIKMFIELNKINKDENIDKILQDRMYGFAAEFPNTISVTTDNKNKSTLKFSNLDEIVAQIFGKQYVRKTEEAPKVIDLKEKKINESYEQFNIGDIEVVFNPDTYECLYSIPTADVKDKKVNLSDIPTVDTPYDTNTIIKSYVETKFGKIPGNVPDEKEKAETADTEVADTPVTTDTTSTKDTTPVNTGVNEDELPEEPEEDTPKNTVDTETPAPEEVDKDTQKDQSETGSTKFVKIRPKQSVSIEEIRERMLEGDTPESQYIVVDHRDLSQEDWDQLTKDLTTKEPWLADVKSVDRKNYSFNVIEVSGPNTNYSLLIDPLGYDYPRYLGIKDNA